eukprot:gene11874-biopygen18434
MGGSLVPWLCSDCMAVSHGRHFDVTPLMSRRCDGTSRQHDNMPRQRDTMSRRHDMVPRYGCHGNVTPA